LNVARGSQAVAEQSVRQVYVVTATKEIPQFTAIRADALAIKAFPAAFAPASAAAKIEDLDGKFATTSIMPDQIVLTSQASTTRRSSNLSASIPPGKVAFWMPVPDLLASTGGLQLGDHFDLLLSVELSQVGKGAPADQVTGISTQTTLQNVEVYFVGQATNADAPDAGGTPANGAKSTGQRVMAVLVDPQDALMIKYIKDSGGTIDLVLRGRDAKDPVSTEAVTADQLMDRFKFRLPQQWSTGGK
jgi:pilus assembly protein CpaB